MSSSEFSVDEAKAWMAAIRSELAEVNDRIEQLSEKQARLEEREGLLRELLKSYGEEEPDPMPQQLRLRESASSTRPGSETVGGYVVAHAAEILRESGTPMHINDL